MVDVTKTRDQLIDRAATDLGLVQPGEPVSSEDRETLDDLIDPLIAQLNADRVAYIQDADDIPVDVFIPLASLLANQAGPAFGSAVNDNAWARDIATLRRINSTDPTYQVMKTVYY